MLHYPGLGDMTYHIGVNCNVQSNYFFYSVPTRLQIPQCSQSNTDSPHMRVYLDVRNFCSLSYVIVIHFLLVDLFFRKHK